MHIIAGHLSVVPERRDEYLSKCTDAVLAARSAPGCIDFALSADLLQPERVNVFECWQDVASVEAFRGSGPDDELTELITGADVSQHEVVSSVQL